MTEETGEWLECVVDTDYEIFSEYPHPIKRKNSDKVVKECRSHDYIVCKLNRKQYLKHRIIAEQFIPNPNNLPQVDHQNHDRTDNRIENLRWVSAKENQRNKSSNHGITYEFFEEIPCENQDDIIYVRNYGEHQFEDLYYCNNWFYVWNGITYRRLHIGYTNRKYATVHAYDVEGKSCLIYYSIFKRLHNIQ